ncbi:MAG: DUF3014 domain-containing protein [Steroidobacteraceae bacterium]
MAINSDKPLIWGAAAVVVAGAIALFLYARREHVAPAPPGSAPEAHSTPPVTSPPPASAPIIEYPVAGGQCACRSGPAAADQSDPAFLKALSGLAGAQALEKLLVPENMIRHIVVTVDNLSRKKVAVNQRPLKPTGGPFMTLSNGDKVVIDPPELRALSALHRGGEGGRSADRGPAYYHFYPAVPECIR